MHIKKLRQVDSTNTWAAQNEKTLPSMCLVYSHSQVAGRGQRGNSWESEPGKNITASILWHPESFEAPRQFRISESIALALVEYLRQKGVDAKVKWPNDIYVGDKKICGILVEHVVTGKHITRTIAGFGLNMNQTEFLSDAPNPVSLKQITGKEYNIDTEVELLSSIIEKHLEKIEDKGIHSDFLDKLWRKDGKFHKFYDRKENEAIEGRIISVMPSGLLTLELPAGEKRDYTFKEIEFIL